MQNKLVENWLTNVNELSFTPPFVQLLTAEGYTVILSKGGVVEQGKDIIAKDKDGQVHCFQLKCGNIGSKEWQAINGQINDLTGIAPAHPALSNTPKEWICHLVTNGDITGPVLKTISDYSQTNVSSGRMALSSTSKDELIRRFYDAFGQFFPTEPHEARIFFELYCEDGDSTLKNKDFKRFLERLLESHDMINSKQKKFEAIQSLPVIVSYLLTNKYSSENNIALIDGWILALLTILHYANKWSIPEKNYSKIEAVIQEEIERIGAQLMLDIANNDSHFVDTTYGVFSEPIVSRALRCSMLLGYTSAIMNYSSLSGRSLPDVPKSFVDKLAEIMQARLITGESGVPYFFNNIVASILAKQDDIARDELKNLIQNILSTHEDKDSPGLPSPYYSIEQTIAHSFKKEDSIITESFYRRSYMLWTAVLLLAKYDERDFLSENWRLISQISMEEVVAHDQNDLLLWEAKKSDMLDTFPNAEQSWSELQGHANKNYDSEIPPLIIKRKYLVPLFVLAMPHRLSPKVILSLLNS